MKPKRPKVQAIRALTFFEMDRVEELVIPPSSAKEERAFSVPGLYLGTSAFPAGVGKVGACRWSREIRNKLK